MKLIAQGPIRDREAFLKSRNIVNPPLPSQPKFYVEFDHLVVICFWSESASEVNERTVYAFDRDGKVIWQIESLRKQGSTICDYDPYVTVIYDTVSGRLNASTSSECDVDVNLKTGAVHLIGGRFRPPPKD